MPAISSTLSASADIERRIIPMILALDAASDSRTRMSLIEVFDRDLNQVQNTYERVWTEDLEIHLQGAKLFLYGFSISPVGKQNTSNKAYQADSSTTTLRIVIQLGLAAAVRIARVASRLKYYIVHVSGKGSPDGSGGLVHPPKQHYRTLFFATVFLLWFLAIDIQASDADKELARNYTGAMHRLFLSFGASPEHLRVAKTIEALGSVPASVSASLSNSNVSGRLGASFMYTVLRNCMIYGNTSQIVPPAMASMADEEELSGSEEPYGARKGSSSQMSQVSQGGQMPIDTFFPEGSQQFLQDMGGQAWDLGFGGWMGGMGGMGGMSGMSEGFNEFAQAGGYQDVVSSPEGQASMMGVAPGPPTRHHSGQYGYAPGGGGGAHGGHGGHGGEYR